MTPQHRAETVLDMLEQMQDAIDLHHGPLSPNEHTGVLLTSDYEFGWYCGYELKGGGFGCICENAGTPGEAIRKAYGKFWDIWGPLE